jgi:hypothetical protein
MADITYSTLSDATTATNGSGNFDKLVQVVTLHLEAQFAAGRITGTDYANVYLGALQSTLDQAVNFTLSMNKANEDATLTEKQQSLVDNQAATELKQALDVAEATILKDKQGLLVDKQTLTEVKQALDIVNQTTNRTAAQTTSESTAVKQRLDIEAATSLKGAQEDLVDKQVLTETAKELQVDAQTSLVGQQEITEFAQTEQSTANSAPVTGSLLALQALKVEQDTALAADQEALVAQQKLTEEKNTTLVDKRGADVEKDSELKTAQKALVDQQKLTEVENTDLVDKQAATEEKKKLDLESATSVRNAQSSADTTLKGKQGSKIDADKLLVDANELLVDAQKLKVDEEKGLLAQKKITEWAQTKLGSSTGTIGGVLGEQIALFEQQAKGFKWNADAKYFKTMMDAYAINVSVSKEDDEDTKLLQGGDNNDGIDKIIDDMKPT